VKHEIRFELAFSSRPNVRSYSSPTNRSYSRPRGRSPIFRLQRYPVLLGSLVVAGTYKIPGHATLSMGTRYCVNPARLYGLTDVFEEKPSVPALGPAALGLLASLLVATTAVRSRRRGHYRDGSALVHG
jgi:hypothetical protein